MPYALGATVTLQLTALASATVVLNVTAPDGTESTPATSNVLTTWSASVTANQLGLWQFTWIVTGTESNVEQGTFQVGTPWYATLAELQAYLPSGTSDLVTQLSDSLATASRSIDKATGRRFWADTAATSRLFYPNPDRWSRTLVDDFYTTTGLVVEVDASGDGVFETTYTSADYELSPLNGVVDGEDGWPYYRIRPVNWAWVCNPLRASLRVTAKWGWTAVPAAVKTACVILATEALKLAREAPFGVAGFGVDGLVRVRENPRVRDMLAPYTRSPVNLA
jgi:hypothetical protein